MLTEAPRSMDPADQNATATRSVLSSFYETLVQFDEFGHIRPQLATDWSSSADGLEWRFHIRPNVFFHDGLPCDVDAVTASFRRLLDLAIPLAGAGVSRTVIRSVRQDGGSIVFTLKHPYADFLPLLTMTQTAVVSPDAARNGTLALHAVGTGPYVFEAWHSGDDVLTHRNPAYWGQAASFDGLKWIWSSEPSVLNMALQTGDADVVVPLSPVFANLYREQGHAAQVASVHASPGATLFWAALNMHLKPLDDARVRRALSLALDRTALVAGLLHGYGQPACSALTPDIHGALPCGVNEAHADLSAARALLKTAGLENGFSIIAVVQEPEEPMAEAIQAMWKQIGVRLEIRRQEAGVWVQSAFAPPDVKAHEQTGVILTSWSAPFLADMQLRPIYASASAAPQSANLGFFADLSLDALIDRAAGSEEAAQRQATLKEIQILLKQQVPVLPLYVADTLYGVRKGVEGVSAGPDGEILVLKARASGSGPERAP
ncbi:ABC transporter substrate-binding protein [Gluconobacter kondonii]|uniref:Glycosyl transferase n=2 Tax=Gluconobacter kondonii TaxID=941463 RepID=A0ABQ5WVI5_9PROT|nr:ABC transporter substrate-binding protein [Gluconobacter kondonii]GBR29983.1 dipeptide ABC transporter substrate-binding periplasmic protein [Gluconobacter kondonii NBRC 3266]GLQ66629.1 glycosyl transferase [Gluconobacter kondonii]